MRRALILALGTYGTDGLSPGEREPLIAKLLDLYENDPDSGIHGAAEWTLRKWGQQAEAHGCGWPPDQAQGQGRGPRAGIVNSQGQTFAMIEGPVEFRMGSPPSEPDRHRPQRDTASAGDPPPLRDRRQGGDRRAISTFASENPGHRALADSTVQPGSGQAR